MSIFVEVPTLTVPVKKLNKDGIPSMKTIDYAVECSLGNNKLLNFSLRQFHKNGKTEPVPFVTVTVDLQYRVTVKMFESSNTKGFITIDGGNITNLSPLVIEHYLDNFSDIKTSGKHTIVDQSFLLFNALLPLFSSEIVLKDLKSGITRQIKALSEDEVNKAWLAISSNDALIVKIQDYIKANQATQTNKTASKAV